MVVVGFFVDLNQATGLSCECRWWCSVTCCGVPCGVALQSGAVVEKKCVVVRVDCVLFLGSREKLELKVNDRCYASLL